MPTGHTCWSPEPPDRENPSCCAPWCWAWPRIRDPMRWRSCSWISRAGRRWRRCAGCRTYSTSSPTWTPPRANGSWNCWGTSCTGARRSWQGTRPPTTGTTCARAPPRIRRCPRLVVLIDEFRVFATELPEALERVVHIATVGRSLGIHLVLSTQRPAGTVSAPLRANIGSVIALRTIGESESNDLIGSPVAARLDPRDPGPGVFAARGRSPGEVPGPGQRPPERPAPAAGIRPDLGERCSPSSAGIAGAGRPPGFRDPARWADAELAAAGASASCSPPGHRARAEPLFRRASPGSCRRSAGRCCGRCPSAPGSRRDAGSPGACRRPAPLVFDPRTTARLHGLRAAGLRHRAGARSCWSTR